MMFVCTAFEDLLKYYLKNLKVNRPDENQVDALNIILRHYGPFDFEDIIFYSNLFDGGKIESDDILQNMFLYDLSFELRCTNPVDVIKSTIISIEIGKVPESIKLFKKEFESIKIVLGNGFLRNILKKTLGFSLLKVACEFLNVGACIDYNPILDIATGSSMQLQDLKKIGKLFYPYYYIKNEGFGINRICITSIFSLLKHAVSQKL